MKKKTALEREKQHQIALLNQENQQMEQYQSEEIRQKSNELKSVFNQINRDNTLLNRLKAEAEEMKRRNDSEKEIDSDKPLLEGKEEDDDDISPNITPKGEEESTLTPNMTIREERIEEMLYQKEYHEKMKQLGAISEENEEDEISKESIKKEKIEIEKPKSNNTKSLDLPPDLYRV